MEALERGLPVERPARSRVQLGGDRGEAIRRVDGEISALAAWRGPRAGRRGGKYWRSRPFVFSFVPRCHGLARSQNEVALRMSSEKRTTRDGEKQDHLDVAWTWVSSALATSFDQSGLGVTGTSSNRPSRAARLSRAAVGRAPELEHVAAVGEPLEERRGQPLIAGKDARTVGELEVARDDQGTWVWRWASRVKSS